MPTNSQHGIALMSNGPHSADAEFHVKWHPACLPAWVLSRSRKCPLLPTRARVVSLSAALAACIATSPTSEAACSGAVGLNHAQPQIQQPEVRPEPTEPTDTEQADPASVEAKCIRFSVDGVPRGIAIGGDGRTLLAVTDTHAEAWDTTTRQQLFRKEVGPGQRRGYLFALPPGHIQRAAVSQDGSLLAVTFPGENGGSLIVWDRSGTPIVTVRGDNRLTGHAVVFSPLGSHVVAGASSGKWVAWSTESGQEETPENRCLAGCRFVNPELHPTTALWFARSDELHAFSPGLTLWAWKTKSIPRLIHRNAEEQKVYGVSPELMVLEPPSQMIGVASGGPVSSSRLFGDTPAAVSCDGKRVIAGGRDHIVREVRTPDYASEETHVQREYTGANTDIVAVAMSSSTQFAPLAAICADGSICVWPGE